MTPEQAATFARLLAAGWELMGDTPFPSQQEHEDVCARLGLNPTLGQEPEMDRG